MRYLEYLDLRFYLLLLKTYPEYFNIIFFLREEKDLLEWAKLITKITGVEGQESISKSITFYSNKVILTLCLYQNQDFLGKRANVVIIDHNFSAQLINEVFCPICISKPIQLCYLCEHSAEYFKQWHKDVEKLHKND